MSYYFAVYGYDITREIEFDNFILFPKNSNFKEAQSLAKDNNKFNLTALGKVKGEPNAQDLFDLAGALTFCQQQWVIVSEIHTFPKNIGIQRSSYDSKFLI